MWSIIWTQKFECPFENIHNRDLSLDMGLGVELFWWQDIILSSTESKLFLFFKTESI